MAHSWPDESRFTQITLSVRDRDCVECGRETYVKDYKRRRVHLLGGPAKIVSQMTLCPDRGCAGHHHLTTAEEETLISPPWWILGWDAFAHLGHLRFARHMAVPEIREDLRESYEIDLSEDAIEDYLGRYRAILAARQRDPAQIQKDYRGVKRLILSIDGLQPEKGHETLYTVRELNAKRVWFAVPLLSSSHEEVKKLLIEAKGWVDRLRVPVQAWISDKQEAFVSGIAEVFPGVPHRYCQNHFLRDVAKPVLEADSHAKVQMRRKVRGLRAIEKDILEGKPPSSSNKDERPDANGVVLEYCSAVRGILNRNQGGPLDPPGLRMADALKDVRESIHNNIDKRQGGTAQKNLERLETCIDGGLAEVGETLEKIPAYVEDLRAIQRTLDPKEGKCSQREATFRRLRGELAADEDPIRQEMAGVMERFEPGLFAGGDKLAFLKDNLDLERWFRLPKSHERRIHGRQHAGIRIVHEGPSLLLALDAHHGHRRPFTEDELRAYLGAKPTEAELEAIQRRKIMRRAASRRTLPPLLADLEARYSAAKAPKRRSRSRSHVTGG